MMIGLTARAATVSAAPGRRILRISLTPVKVDNTDHEWEQTLESSLPASYSPCWLMTRRTAATNSSSSLTATGNARAKPSTPTTSQNTATSGDRSHRK